MLVFNTDHFVRNLISNIFNIKDRKITIYKLNIRFLHLSRKIKIWFLLFGFKCFSLTEKFDFHFLFNFQDTLYQT